MKMRVLSLKLFINRVEDLVGVWCGLFDHTILNGVVCSNCSLVGRAQA